MAGSKQPSSIEQLLGKAHFEEAKLREQRWAEPNRPPLITTTCLVSKPVITHPQGQSKVLSKPVHPQHNGIKCYNCKVWVTWPGSENGALQEAVR